MKAKFLFICVCILTLGSCSQKTTTLYSWYDYEDSTYKYSKTNTEEDKIKMIEQYKKIAEKQRGTRKTVQPGLYAEYGFILYKAGKKSDGITFLKEEIRLYPESEKYISRIIKQLEK